MFKEAGELGHAPMPTNGIQEAKTSYFCLDGAN